MKTYFILLSIFCIYFFYKGIARLYTRSLACRKFCWTMLFRSNTQRDASRHVCSTARIF